MNRFNLDKQPQDVLQELALKHKVLRKQAGFTQAELAERSGVSLGSIKRFETSGQISLESLLSLLHILDRLNDFEAILKPIENRMHIEKLFSDKTRIGNAPTVSVKTKNRKFDQTKQK